MALPSVSVVALANGNEADGSPVVFKFERTGDTSAALSVGYQLFGTARAGGDYTGSTTGTISFAAGSATSILSLPALADGALIDPGETIIARIDPAAGYSITTGKQTATATITAEGMYVSINVQSRLDGSHNGGEYQNLSAFAALKNNGSVVTWGGAGSGGDSSAVKSSLASGITQIYSTQSAFAALKDDGSVVTWGGAGSGGDSSAVKSSLASGVKQIYSTQSAFAALKDDGSVVTWGNAKQVADSIAKAPILSSGVTQISSTYHAFAALKADGSVATWGNSSSLEVPSYLAVSLLSGVKKIFSSGYAFAALKHDGSFVSWGSKSDISNVASKLTSGVLSIAASVVAFAALKDDGSVVTWGDYQFGGDSSAVANTLTSGVTQLFSSADSFAALKSDGSVVYWGGTRGRYPISSSVSESLSSGVSQIFSTRAAFAALKSDGSVVTWGELGYNPDNQYGADSSRVTSKLTSGVTQIFATARAFAALKDDGSVVTWGDTSFGGDSSAVANRLTSGVVQIFATDHNYGGAFAALKDDGSVVTWGMPDFAGEAPLDLRNVVGFANSYTEDRLIINVITLTVGSASIAEDGLANLIYTFTRTGATTNALTVNYGIAGTADSSDYTGAIAGTGKTITFAANSATATLTIDPTADATIESDETVALTLATGTGYSIGTTTAVVGTISNDDKLIPTYTISPSSGEINEGSTLTTTVATTNVATGTTLYWSIGGTGINATDFSSGALTGSGVVGTDAKFSFAHTASNDLTTEGDETLQIKLFADSALMAQVGSTASVTLKDTSLTPVPTYALTPSSSNINEGATLTTTVATTNIASGTTLYWSVGGTGINASDFSKGSLAGSGTVGADGKFSFSHKVASDLTTEGGETLQLKLFTDSARTLQVGSTASLLVKDTSIKPAATYVLTPSSNSINEGATLTTNVATTNVASGTTLYWSVGGTGINAADFTSGALLGSGTVGADGKFSFSHTLANDLTTEGDEPLQIKLFSDSARTLQVGSTANVTLKDTSFNNAPTEVRASASRFNSNVLVDSTISILNTVDQDLGNTFTYALVSGTGSADNGAFAISGNQLVLKTAPNHASKKTYSIRVRSTDQGGLSTEKILGFVVNGAPTDLTSTAVSFNENIVAATPVATLGSVDPDNGDSFTYSLVSGAGSADNGAFTLVDNQLQINASPDFETKSSYAIRVRTTDQDGLFLEKNLNFAVNNLVEKVASGASIVIAANKDTLQLTGAKNVFGMGNQFDNTITGNSGRNKLTGGLGKDVLTGGTGVDTFFYSDLKESLLSGFDVITDYASAEKISVGFNFEGDDLIASTGKASALNEGAIGSVLTNTTFLANNAAAFTVEGRTGTFLALNDGRDGFQEDSDALIHLSNYTIGSKTPVSII